MSENKLIPGGRVADAEPEQDRLMDWLPSHGELSEHLRQALRVARLGYWKLNLVTDEFEASVTCKALFGLAPSAAVTRERLHATVHPDDRERVAMEVQRAIESGGDYEVEFRVLWPDGSEHWLLSRARALCGGSAGTPQELVGVALDVTERKQAEEDRTRLASIVDQTGDAILSTDVHGIVRTCNAAAQRKFGYTEAELIGQHINVLIPPEHREDEVRVRKALCAGERSGPFDAVRLTREGKRVDVSVTASPIRDASGKIVGVSCIWHDITDRKAAERALRESEARFRHMADHAPVMIWTSDADGRCTLLSKAWYDFTGQAKSEAEGWGWLEAVHPDDRAAAEEAFRAASQTRSVLRTEYRLRRHDGEYRRVLDSAAPRFDSDNNFLGYIGSAIDITEVRRAEESTSRLAAIVRSSIDVIISKDLQGTITSWNAAAENLFGYTAAEAIGRKITMIIPPELRAEEDWILAHLREGKGIEPFETVRITRDGRRIPVFITISPMFDSAGRIIGGSKVLHDVSARKQAVEKMRASEEQLRLSLQSARGGSWDWDIENDVQAWSDELFELFGVERETVAPSMEAWLNLVHPEDRKRCREATQEALADRREYEVEFRVAPPHGQLRWIYSRGKTFFNGRGRPVRMAGIALDVTERKRAQEALRESEARFRLMADNAPILIWVNDLQGCQYVNREYLRFTGATAAELQGMQWAAWLHPEDAEGYLSAYRRAVESRAFFDAQVRMRRADGEYRWLRSTASPRFTAEGELVGYVGCSADVTEARNSEHLLRIADENKNQFIANIGHELRNPLAAIEAGVTLLRKGASAKKRAWTQQMVERQVHQLRRLVDDLLDITRISYGKVALQRKRMELGKAVRDAAATTVHFLAERGHKLTLRLPRKPLYAEADPARIEQILVNLLTNAAKYSPEKGKIALTLRREGNEAVIACRDQGIGLSPEIRDAIFEPFVQAHGRATSGLGIGLALVKRFTEMHGGRVEARSEGVGKGSEFLVRLPAMVAPRRESRKAAGAAVQKAPATPPLSVLVVDDNRDLAQGIAMILEDWGHRVTQAYNGESGLAAALRVKPDVVLMDLGLPDIDGYVLATKMREGGLADSTMVVAISGYKLDAERARTAGLDVHLSKPVRAADLAPLLTKAGTMKRGLKGRNVAAPRRRVLLIEDNAEVGLLTAQLLRRQGHQVRLAVNGIQGIQKAKAFKPNVVISDLRLPDQSGFDVARILRADRSLQPLCLVGLTADSVDHLAGSEGAFDFLLTKPLQISQLEELLREFGNQPALATRAART